MTMGKAVDSAAKLLNGRVTEATGSAIIKMEEATKSLKNKIKETEQELDRVKDEIRYESNVRKFLLWFTPVLLLVQTVLLIVGSL